MSTIKVLIQGYAKEIAGGWLASSTVTLIQDKEISIIVDPGINRRLLLSKLAENNLTPDQINFVFMTHYHPDHNLLVGIFDQATILDPEMIYTADQQISHQQIIPNTDIKIISTPGHDQPHGSLLVPTQEGTIVIAGDVFGGPIMKSKKLITPMN